MPAQRFCRRPEAGQARDRSTDSSCCSSNCCARSRRCASSHAPKVVRAPTITSLKRRESAAAHPACAPRGCRACARASRLPRTQSEQARTAGLRGSVRRHWLLNVLRLPAARRCGDTTSWRATKFRHFRARTFRSTCRAAIESPAAVPADARQHVAACRRMPSTCAVSLTRG